MTTVAACRTCGTKLLENAQFCHGCGSPVVEPAAHAEYKQVSVLFADMVRSMDIATAVGAERLREIMAELANRCAARSRSGAGEPTPSPLCRPWVRCMPVTSPLSV